MDFEERWYFYGEGCYIGCEGTFFIWVDTITLLRCRREFVGVEITWPFEPSKGMHVEHMILFYNVGKNILCTHSFMKIRDVCVYFVVSLSFDRAWLCEP
jgi:hypothetical protein